MCLNTVTKLKPNNKIIIAWKVFRNQPYKNCSYYNSIFFNEVKFRVNRWEKDNNKFLIKVLDPYETGFHSFKTRRGARDIRDNDEIIKKVKIRNIIVEGFQHQEKCWVSKELLIIK